MAILMIKDRDATHPDPIKEARGCYRRGDVVQVFEDTQALVLPPAPPFVFVKIAGVTKAQAERLMEPHTEACTACNGVRQEPPCSACHGTGRIVKIRRLHHIDWTALPAGVRNALVTNRYYETTWAAVRQFVKNKLTGVGA